ncbi:hypothetical protein RE6C_00603 [Rhodopirellula europaea 6C]|uniref:Uncharacterized protein n=1 Tax=Rhodopirellula europaea 6C TaxID=1263867 RepID=M2B187_9BACT|nr:hypothetical protein RE6C_00603 [Rhodopirellula europaea 6C]
MWDDSDRQFLFGRLFQDGSLRRGIPPKKRRGFSEYLQKLPNQSTEIQRVDSKH